MIDYLFTLLLVPVLPELASPNLNHATALSALEQRLNQSQQVVPTVLEAAEVSEVQQPAPSLPKISGRLFSWSSTDANDEKARKDAVVLSAEALTLTGMIESSGQRVAILSDGEKDHVVGVGSYVLDAYKVVSFGPGQVVLMPLDGQAGGKPLQLNLMPGVLPGGF